MITSIELKNFKSFREAKIDLERFTVFVGANASGKTSVLSAIDLAGLAANSSMESDAPHVLETAFFENTPDETLDWDRHCSWSYTRGGSGPTLIAFESKLTVFRLVAIPPEGFTGDSVSSKWQIKVEPSKGSMSNAVSVAIPSVKFLRLNGRMLARASYSDFVVPEMDVYGYGLASELSHLKLTSPDQFATVVESLKGVLPGLRIQDIRLKRERVHRSEKEYIRIGDDTLEHKTTKGYTGEAILFDFENAPNVAAHAASEGTLILLGLLTVILGPNRPKILLLDDIEHGLHPLAQKNLIETIGKLLEQFPDLQILATAHSPYLLDYLQPEQVRLLALDDQGHSVCGKLTDHPEFEKWKDEMAPGEMWSLFGEKWLTEGAAKS